MADSGAAAATGDGGAAAGTAVGTAANQPWFQGVAGVDQEMVGHWTNRGWDKKSPAEVAVEATKAWKAAETYVGVPAAQIVRLPKDATDEAGINTLWTRLGRPQDANGYDFGEVKRADGTAPDEGLVTTLRQAAFKANLPKDAATVIARELAGYMDKTNSLASTEKAAKLAEQKAALKMNWGANEAANTFVAQRAAAALGIPPETVSALEGVIGYDKIMEMFRTIGSKIGEDKFITGTPASGGGVMTKEAAVAKRAELMTDKDWAKAYLAGDAAKLREMKALNILISGDAG